MRGGNPSINGLVPCYLHDFIEVGDILEIRAPTGNFIFDDGTDRAVVLISSGVGLTPSVC